MKRKKWMVLTIGIVIIGTVSLFGIQSIYYGPNMLFKRVVGFELPNTAEIVKYERDGGGFFEVYAFYKIELSENDMNIIRAKLLDPANKIGFYKMRDDEYIPNHRNSCAWWDLDKNAIFESYHRFTTGKHIKTREIAIYFQKGEKYLMYVAVC